MENLGGEYCDRGLHMSTLGPERPFKRKKGRLNYISLRRQCHWVHYDFQFIHKAMNAEWFKHFSESQKNKKNPELPSFDAHSRRSRFWALPRWHSASLAPMLKTSQTRYKTKHGRCTPAERKTLRFVHCKPDSPNEERKKKKKREKLKKCLRFHVAFESFSFPLQAWFFRFIWQTLMLPESQRLHCSGDLLGKGKNIDLYRCRNTVQESESMKYTWREVDALVLLSFLFEKLSTRSQLGIWRPTRKQI